MIISLIREPRPLNLLKDGSFGMPSSHSQFIAFFCTFGIIHVYKHRGPDKLRGWEWLVYSVLLTSFVVVPYSRVYLNYHTLAQVVVGSLVGTAFGIFWYQTLPILNIVWPWLDQSIANKLLSFTFEKQKQL